jgi:N6-adenosine-specific RNA methylase IME4
MSDVTAGTADRPKPVTDYRTILADPPWELPQRGERGPRYPLLSVEAICRLPVAPLAATDAHLWLWVTNSTIFAGRQVMTAWGFSYRSCLTWIKPRFGLGPYLRNQTEHLLLGVRGRAPTRFKGQGTWLYAPLQEHSHKPEEQYAVIERCSPGPYLELFARHRQPGWHVWGDEVDSDIQLDTE